MGGSWNKQDDGAYAETNDNNDTNGITDDNHDDAEPQAAIDPQAGKEEFRQAARDRGWTAPIAIDYQALASGESDQDGWLANQPRYEWKDSYGDVAPRVPELEEILYGGQWRMREGKHVEALTIFECEVQGPKPLKPIRSFEDAGLHPVILENLKLCGYAKPTPVQAYCIPYGLEGRDMVAVAQTGSGKTAAYMIPVLSKLMGKANKLQGPRPNLGDGESTPAIHKVRAEPLVVIVVPTRELAIQIFDEARRLCYRSMLRPCVTYGGLPIKDSVADLTQGCDILIATPGRLVDFMTNKADVLSMKRVKYTIIDEADELMNNDWEEALGTIMSGGDMNHDGDHTFMLFSATFQRQAMALAQEYLESEYYKISVGRVGSTHKNIKQNIIWVDSDQKQKCIWDLLMTLEPERTLIFCNSKKAVDNLDDLLYNRGLPTTSIHSDRPQREREDSLRAFRSGKCPIMIATGVSARGWDIHGIANVINYDLPDSAYGGFSEYTHRIGRTARIGHKGTATSFYNERNEDLGKDLANLLIESGNEVPDFLQQYVHEDGQAHFDEDAEDGGIAVENGGEGDAW